MLARLSAEEIDGEAAAYQDAHGWLHHASDVMDTTHITPAEIARPIADKTKPSLNGANCAELRRLLNNLLAALPGSDRVPRD